ncbi:BBE domain-containing protein [Agromyces humatus]|uniref:BBE domain-containing protein n=1 Tax=Agromyces humatus TaxID=279573 RepID=UPI0031D25934
MSLQAYGGAIAEVDDEETAFSGRDTAFEFVAASRWQDASEDDRRIAAARRYAATMERFASGVYVNALADEGVAGVRRAYSDAKLVRLAAVKAVYDPGNVFDLNQNIRPSAG